MLEEELRTADAPHAYWRPASGALPDAEDIDGMVILGGTMGANDEELFPHLADLKKLVREAESLDVPVLGICLGGQLMAEALGGRLTPERNGEKGIADVSLTTLGCFDPLFEGIPYNFVTFQWHNDSFVMPEGAILLARNTSCPHQAFRYGRSAYGLQFHPEMNLATGEAWIAEKRPDLMGLYKAKRSQHEGFGRKILSNFITMSIKRPVTAHRFRQDSPSATRE